MVTPYIYACFSESVCPAAQPSASGGREGPRVPTLRKERKRTMSNGEIVLAASMRNDVQTALESVVNSVLPSIVKSIMFAIGALGLGFVLLALLMKKFLPNNQMFANIDAKQLIWTTVVATILVSPSLVKYVGLIADGLIFMFESLFEWVQGLNK